MKVIHWTYHLGFHQILLCLPAKLAVLRVTAAVKMGKSIVILKLISIYYPMFNYCKYVETFDPILSLKITHIDILLKSFVLRL